MPPELFADPKLNSTAKALAAALVENFAWTKDHCWPSDAKLAKILGKSVGHVQRCLRLLEAFGWIRREATGEVRNGRRIWLLWRCGPGAGAQSKPAPARSTPPAPARTKNPIVIVNHQKETNPVSDSSRQRPEVDAEAHPPCPRDPSPPCSGLAPDSEPTDFRPLNFSNLAGLLAQIGSLDRSPVPSGARPEPVRHAVPACTSTVEPVVRPKPLGGSPPIPAPRPSEDGDSLSPSVAAMLTEAQRHRLRGLSEKTRRRVETLLSTGDRICQGEALRLLKPPPEPRPAPQGVEELLSRLREDPVYPSQAAEALAQAFDDRRSWGTYHAVCQRAWSGQVPCSALLQAWREATNGRARNPGALFMSVLKREAPGWNSSPRPF